MNHREEDDPFEEDIVFDQAGLLTSHKSGKSAIRRISSGKCATFSKTLALCGAFLGLGLTCAIPGPLSPVPPPELSNDVSLMSPEIMFRCFGFMIGAMFGAKLLDRFNRLFLVFLALLLTSVLVIIIPWCRMAWLLRSDMFLVGATIGFLSTGGNVLCLDLWGRNSGPFMQALQFSFSLGVFLAPLLSQPLMSSSNITTPSAFPHTRLPRSVLAMPATKSYNISSFMNNSSDGTLQPSLTSLHVGIHSSTAFPVENSSHSVASMSSSSFLQKSTSATPIFLASSTPSQPPSSVSKLVLPGSLVHAPPTNLSHISVENSSTTHRVPKPKPELTNSDKLKDKNWENNKFRKPPPEDLVPVSSTMRTTTHSSSLAVSTNSSSMLNATTPNTTVSSSHDPTSKPISSGNLTISVAPSHEDIPLNPHTPIISKSALVPTSSSSNPSTTVSPKSTKVTPSARPQKLSSPPLFTSTKAVPSRGLFTSHSTTKIPSLGLARTTEVPGLMSLSLLGSSKPPISDNQDGEDQQTHLLPLLEKPVVGDMRLEEHSLPIVKATTPQLQNYQRQSQSQPLLNQIKRKEEAQTNSTIMTVATVSSKISPQSSVMNGGDHDPSNVSTSTVASTRRTHHSKPASTVVNDTEVTHTVIGAFANRLEKYGLSKMELIYLVVGMVLLATSLLFLGFLCFNPRDPKSKTDEEDVNGLNPRGRSSSTSSSRPTAPPPLPRWLRNTLMALMFVILLISSGIQAMYGQLLQVFATQSPLQLSESTGNALTATFWGALTSSRFACILLASALSPSAMLVLSVALCSCATWLLSALASSSEVALWIGSVMVGVGTASVFPSGLLWMQRHVVVTHRVAAMLVMGPAMGEMLLPMLVYRTMVAAGPGSLLHLPALLSLCVIALWATAWRLSRTRRPRWQEESAAASGYQLANQNDEDDLLDLTMSPVINGGAGSAGAVQRGRSYANGHSFHRLSS